jgi:hypothetical protein
MRCTDPPASQRLRVLQARAAHEPARCTRSSADPPACTARTRRGQALHRPSRCPVTRTGPTRSGKHHQPGRTSLGPYCWTRITRIVTRSSANPRACHRQAPARTHAARTFPRLSDSNWTWSAKHHQPGRTALRPTCWSRSSANPGPASARPLRALARHRPSRGPVTQTGPEPTTPPGCTSRARADSTTPVKCDTQGKRYPTQSTT